MTAKEKLEELLNTIEGKIIDEDLYLLENHPHPKVIRDYLIIRCKIHLGNYTGNNLQQYQERFMRLR